MIDDLDPRHYLLLPVEGAREQLAVVFSARGAKPGSFSFFKTMQRTGISVLYVTPPDATWYQTGLVGLGDTITVAFRALADRIERFAHDQGYGSLFIVGDSMGAFAALVFASFTALPKTVVAMGGETLLKLPGARSSEQEFATPEFADIRELAYPDGTTIHLLFGEYDLVDAYCALSVRGRPEYKLYSHSWSPHSVAPELHRDMGAAEFMRNAVRGNFFFPGRGHLAGALRAAHLEPLVFEQRKSRAYLRALNKALLRYPAFRLGWTLLADRLLLDGDVKGAADAVRRANWGDHPPARLAKVMARLAEADPAPATTATAG